jgi:hypothetical protein
MATVTPNFNWPVPTSTDLVKDGATAIEALGDSIDASLVDLKGGTSGQVLSKNSNTDMDFVWVTSDDANAIQNTIVDAKGDLITATAADTPARLAVGNNGETLVADSSTSTGLRYTAGNPIANPVINSAMQVWQRGTSFTNGASTTAFFGADRWRIYSAVATGRTWSRQATNDTTNLPFIQYCTRVARNSGDTQLNGLYIVNDFESVNSIPYAGKTITFSYYARCGANYSASGNGSVVTLITGTGTDQNSLNGFTGSALPVNTSATLTTTWQRFTFTATLGSNITQIAIQLGYIPTGTAGANDYFEVTGVQIDIGSVALPFRTNGATLQGELAACRRYLPAIVGGNGAEIGMGYAYGSNSPMAFVKFDVVARVKPTGITSAGNWRWYALNTGTVAGVSFNAANQYGATLVNTSGVTITAGQGTRLYGDDSDAIILFTGCEL